MQITDRVLELHDRGKNPVKAKISAACADDLRAYFEFNFLWDGILPRDYFGLALEYVHGADRKVEIVCE